MSNSETPTGGNGIKKNSKKLNIKYASNEEIQERWDKFFETNELTIDAFYFDYPESEKTIGGDDDREEHKNSMSDMNVLSPSKYKARIEEIVNGAKIAIKRDELDKIKRAKTRAIEKKLALKEKADKKSPAGGNEKNDNSER